MSGAKYVEALRYIYMTDLRLQKHHGILATDGAKEQTLGTTRSAGSHDHHARRVGEVRLGTLAVIERAVSDLVFFFSRDDDENDETGVYVMDII